MKPTIILGISAYYHDSAAAIIIDGKIVAAAQEERFSRKKHDSNFPASAIDFCLKQAGIELAELSYVVFYDKPFLKFERLLETYLAYAPTGFRSFLMAMPVWIKDKLLLKSVLKKELRRIVGDKKALLPPLLFTEHHQSHAASAFFPSPFEKSAVLCLDGVGEWATSSVWQGDGAELEPLWELHFPHSLGLLYSAFTYYCGFKVNSGEYKLMGLAPYGEPKYVKEIYDNLVDVKDDGTFRLNMAYFNYAAGLTMTSNKFHKLFDGQARKPETPITQKHMDLASSIQYVTEEIVLKIANTIYNETGNTNLCIAGGVALNCVANGRLLRESPFDNVWVQPAAGDAGGALGAALQVWHQYCGGPRVPQTPDSMSGSYLGPDYSTSEVLTSLDAKNAVYTELSDTELSQHVAKLLSEGHVVGWHQGRMEFGPRALGNRSILGDPRDPEMQTKMNVKIKFRESFRPFAPAVLAEHVTDIFDHKQTSPYMLMVAKIQASQKVDLSDKAQQQKALDKLQVVRSLIPAVTHVDDSARLQTVHKETNPAFHRLLEAFHGLTSCPVLINTSFNVRGEPVVNTPEEAYTCFMRTNMDYLVIGNVLLSKLDQPVRSECDDWQNEFELD